MKVVFLLAADMDVQAAYEYLDLVNEGLGDRFLAELEAGTRQISASRSPAGSTLMITAGW